MGIVVSEMLGMGAGESRDSRRSAAHPGRGMVAWIVAVVAALGLMAGAARADVTYPARPLDRAFIADEAKLINDADAAKIVAICNKTLTDKRVPIVVCTITSMADHGASGWAIERYAMNLFDEWGVGAKEYNYGILVLVSKGDRKARIELGAGWTRERDSACAAIMSTDMVPRFKKNDYSGGIAAGVQQLDALARVASKPTPPAGQGAGAPAGGAASPAPSASPTSSPQSVPATSTAQPYSYSNSYSRGSPGSGGIGGLGGLSLGCLVFPLIVIVFLLRMVKGLFGWGGGSWGRGMYPGGYQGGGWGPSWGGSGWSGGDSGGGGGWSGGDSGGSSFGGGSFDGVSSGGGGATGSW